MARSRTISPKFFQNEDLADLPCEARLLFIGLWTIADRSGRLEDRPKRIRIQLFPYGLVGGVETLLESLDSRDFIFRYSINGDSFIQIPKWFTYQRPHPREADSTIPPIPCDLTDFKACRTFSRLSKTLDTPRRSVPSVPSVPSEPSGSSEPSALPRAKSAHVRASVQIGWKDVAFRDFWNNCVWAKIGKGDAHKAYLKVVTSPELVERIAAAAKAQGPRLIAEAVQQGRGVLHPATWLNGERWEDELTLPVAHAMTNSELKQQRQHEIFRGLVAYDQENRK